MSTQEDHPPITDAATDAFVQTLAGAALALGLDAETRYPNLAHPDWTPHRHEQAESRHWLGTCLDEMAVAEDQRRLIATAALAALAARALAAIWGAPFNSAVRNEGGRIDVADLALRLYGAACDEDAPRDARLDVQDLCCDPRLDALWPLFVGVIPGVAPSNVTPLNPRIRAAAQAAAAVLK